MACSQPTVHYGVLYRKELARLPSRIQPQHEPVEINENPHRPDSHICIESLGSCPRW